MTLHSLEFKVYKFFNEKHIQVWIKAHFYSNDMAAFQGQRILFSFSRQTRLSYVKKRSQIPISLIYIYCVYYFAYKLQSFNLKTFSPF